MKRVPCRRDDEHQTIPVWELIKNGVQKGPDGKFHVNSTLPPKVKDIAHPPTNLLGLVGCIAFVALALSVWKLLDPTDWAKAPLSFFAEIVSYYGHWVFLIGAIGFFLLWHYWRPSYMEILRKRREGIYCYGCEKIFFHE